MTRRFIISVAVEADTILDALAALDDAMAGIRAGQRFFKGKCAHANHSVGVTDNSTPLVLDRDAYFAHAADALGRESVRLGFE